MRVSLKTFSQLKSDIRSCQCRNFSVKHVSGLKGGGGGGGGPEPQGLPPGSATLTTQVTYLTQSDRFKVTFSGIA